MKGTGAGGGGGRGGKGDNTDAARTGGSRMPTASCFASEPRRKGRSGGESGAADGTEESDDNEGAASRGVEEDNDEDEDKEAVDGKRSKEEDEAPPPLPRQRRKSAGSSSRVMTPSLRRLDNSSMSDMAPSACLFFGASRLLTLRSTEQGTYLNVRNNFLRSNARHRFLFLSQNLSPRILIDVHSYIRGFTVGVVHIDVSVCGATQNQHCE